MTSYPELAPEAQRVVDWRLEWLCRVYKTANAERIALATDIDYQFAIRLHNQCEDEKLCMHILFGKK
jgi:hypothetical protein